MIGCAIALAGCGGQDHADLRAFMDQAGTGGQQQLEPLPPVKPAETIEYNPGELPDPFKARSLKSSKGGGLQPDLSRPKGPLEQHPLESLRMVGTIIKDGQKYALIGTPEGSLYRVRNGDYIGQNFGMIVAISDTGIEIRETIQDGVGDWIENQASLALKE